MPIKLVTLDDVQDAARRIRTTCLRTPVLDVPHPLGGAPIRVKAESLQRTGSFKLRGATNAVSALDSGARAAGVVTYSSGNHGRALAYAARMAGVAATVVMPETAPAVKIQATRALGATVVLRAPDETVAYAKHLVSVEGLTLVPPYEDPWVIAGQGTVGLELLDQVDDIDVILVPVGGGGLISGVAAAVKSLKPDIKVIGVEPALAGDLAGGYAIRERTRWSKPLVMRTIADGLRSATVGELPWEHIMAFVDDVVTVSEESIISAMALLAETARIVVEPSGAVSTAAVLEHPHRLGAGTTVAIATGGNIDLQDFITLIGSKP